MAYCTNLILALLAVSLSTSALTRSNTRLAQRSIVSLYDAPEMTTSPEHKNALNVSHIMQTTVRTSIQQSSDDGFWIGLSLGLFAALCLIGACIIWSLIQLVKLIKSQHVRIVIDRHPGLEMLELAAVRTQEPMQSHPRVADLITLDSSPSQSAQSSCVDLASLDLCSETEEVFYDVVEAAGFLTE